MRPVSSFYSGITLVSYNKRENCTHPHFQKAYLYMQMYSLSRAETSKKT